jgi:hypothetical protein
LTRYGSGAIRQPVSWGEKTLPEVGPSRNHSIQETRRPHLARTQNLALLENFSDPSLSRRSALPLNPAAISGLSRSFDLAFLRDLRESFAIFAVKGFSPGIKTGPTPLPSIASLL